MRTLSFSDGLTFTDGMNDEEIKLLYYTLNIKKGLTEDEAKRKAEDDLTAHKKIMHLIDNPPEDVSELHIKKCGEIVKKTGKYADIKTIDEIEYK